MDPSFFLPTDFFLALAVLWAFGILSYKSGKIDAPGSVAGVGIGVCLFLGGQWIALLLLLVFFVLGTLASSWQKQKKQGIGLAQEEGGKRSVRHAVANAGIAALMGLLAWSLPLYDELFLTGLAASLSSALGDTFSSELGNLYGRRYLDLRSFQAGKRGEDGVISLEGSLIGFGGSLLIALIASTGWMSPGFLLPVWIGGIGGNLSDSIIGATLQRKGWLTNDGTNFMSTLVASLLGIGLQALMTT